MEDKVFDLGTMVSFERNTNDADGLPAIVSIELQKFGETYDVENGFPCGTVFPAIYKPFLAGGMTR